MSYLKKSFLEERKTYCSIRSIEVVFDSVHQSNCGVVLIISQPIPSESLELLIILLF